ncbi:MAG: DUF4239 domain-containing protein [Gammaproteobacteria bacterium]|nr:DUF4239 domain-containing protein [Gammaproteobacteria bacterium]
MFNFFVAAFTFSALYILLLFSVSAGRRFAQWQAKRHSLGNLETITVIEGAVFGLLGLMIAFTFTGAYERFELRKTHIIEEANVVETAYLRLDMLTPSATVDLRNNFRQYIDTRLSVYKNIPDFNAVYRALEKSEQLQHKIWNQVLAACKITNQQVATEMVVPAINKLFDMENEGIAITKIHPPIVIFVLLIGLTMLSAFLAGYSAVEKHARSSIYILIYVAMMAFIIYLIMDIEFPRVGLVRVDAFDNVLMDVRQRLN